MSIIEILEKRGTIPILSALYRAKNYTMYHEEIIEKSGVSVNTLDKRLLELKNLGYTDEETKDKFGGKRNIWLTKEGIVLSKRFADLNSN